MVNRWLETVHSLLMPPRCVLCGSQGQPPVLDLCRDCARELPENAHPCPRCALPAPDGNCGACRVSSRPFDRAVAPYRYAYPLDHLVRSFKYQGDLAYGRILGTLLAMRLRDRGGACPDVLIPVPLHGARHRARGFNQAHELARIVGRALEVPVDARLCLRTRATDEQTELTATERRRNVRGAFSLTFAPRAAHVAILDDVLTTGSTVSEIARLLRAAGVETIEVWAVARATPAART